VHQIDPRTGRPIRSIGAGLFAMPHGLHVDKDGNVWVTDAAVAKKGGSPKGEQVIKMSPDGKVLMRLGAAGRLGRRTTHFHDPGRCRHRAQWRHLRRRRSWHGGARSAARHHHPHHQVHARRKVHQGLGSLGSGKSQFRNPHALAFDSQGRLLVADRVNGRIRCSIRTASG